MKKISIFAVVAIVFSIFSLGGNKAEAATRCTLSNSRNTTLSLPAQLVAAGTSNFAFVTSDLTAHGCDVNATSFRIEKDGNITPTTLTNIRIVDTATNAVLGSIPAFTSEHVTIPITSFVIPNNTTKHLTILADINSISRSGKHVALGIDNSTGTILKNNITNALVAMNNTDPHLGNKMTIGAPCTPALTVISPNGGETYTVGGQITINWNSCGQGTTGTFGIALQDVNDPYYNTYINTSPIPLNESSFSWTIPATFVGGQYKARVFCSIGEAYCTDSSATSEDLSDSFFTINASVTLPEVQTENTTNISSTSAVLNGTITNNDPSGGNTWFEYGTTPSLGIVTEGMTTVVGTGTYGNTLSILSPNTTYYFKVVSQNSAGTTSGSVLSFTTLNAPVPSIIITSLSGSAVS